jgi:pilus assembly protein CpaE
MHLVTFSVMGSSEQARTEIKNALFGSAFSRLLTECSDGHQLLSDVARVHPSAAVVVLDVLYHGDQLELIKELAAAAPDTAIIAASADTSPTTILGSIRAGAHEFLQLPIETGEFQTVLERISQRRHSIEAAAEKDGRVIAVFSGKGGTGVSFLATNLAAAMHEPTLLIDLNLQSGDDASFLGVEPRYSIADFVANRARLDDALMTSLITPHSANLALLAAPHETHETEAVEPEHVTEILNLVSQRYSRVILDLPHTFDQNTIAALDIADEILLVMTLDIPGIRSTKRALDVLERLGYPRARVHIVVNRWSKNTDVELQRVQAHLGQQFIGFVPNDYIKVMDSINLGRPHVHTEPGSRIALEIKRIAGSLFNDNNNSAAAQPRKRSLRNFFSRQSSSSSLELAANMSKS